MILAFLLCCFFAHYIGDFTLLSTNWMLRCKSAFTGFKDLRNMAGIAAHASVHFVLLTVTAVLFFGWLGVAFGLINLVAHFFIDCGKPMLTNYLVKKGYGGDLPAQRRFWEVMGVDQFLHAATIIIAAYLFV